LFSVVGRSENYDFQDDNPLTTIRAKVASYVLGAYKVQKVKKMNFLFKSYNK